MEIFAACFLGAWMFAACAMVVKRLEKEKKEMEEKL